MHVLMEALKRNKCLGVSSGYTLPIALVGRYMDDLTKHADFIDDRKSLLGWKCAQYAGNCEMVPRPSKRQDGCFCRHHLSSITPYEMNEDLFGYIVDGAFDRAAMAKDLRTDRAAPKRHLPHHFGQKLAQSVNAIRSGSNFSACAAASQAIAAGFWSVRRGEADIALVGGHDSMDHPMGLLSFLVLGALSPNVCRPFDNERNGFMLGEGQVC